MQSWMIKYETLNCKLFMLLALWLNQENSKLLVSQNVIYYHICVALWFKWTWLMGVKMIALKIINWVSCKKFKLLYYLIQFNWVKWELNFYRFCEGLFLRFICSIKKLEWRAQYLFPSLLHVLLRLS